MIPRHDESAPRAIEATRPANIFTSPGRFDDEQARVFRTHPLVATMSALIPEPGDGIVQDGYGPPLLIMRGQDGAVRVFLNACKHKGATLVEHCDPFHAARVTCPYHAWTYGLDGELKAVPREETFRNLDKAERHLTSVPCHEAGGMVWVWLDRESEPDFSAVDDELVADFDALNLAGGHIYGRKRFDLAANWKLVLEPFLEGYHVRRLHANTIGKLYADVPSVTHQLGSHIRQISGKADFTPESLDEAEENIHKTVTHAYQVFPNTVVVTSPYYISVMLIMPRGVDRSVVEYFMVTPTQPDNDKAKDLYERSYELILRVFGTEDFRAAEISQTGLKSGALEELVYGGLEETIPLYYENLERHL
ncbi:MAG: aromatic ring-hydroxylating oxygenase subunit alpha [Pseudomonadota bacterium]